MFAASLPSAGLLNCQTPKTLFRKQKLPLKASEKQKQNSFLTSFDLG